MIGVREPDGRPYDAGAGDVHANPTWRGGFKVPSLRNVGLTPPYMHSGTFDNLYDAAEFYTLGRGHAVPLEEQGRVILHWHIWEPELTGTEIERLVDFLQTLRLVVHAGKSAVFPVRLGVDFVGFRVFPTHRRLRRGNVRRAFRRLRDLRAAYLAGEIPVERMNASVQSWVAHSRYASTYGLRRHLFRQFTF